MSDTVTEMDIVLGALQLMSSHHWSLKNDRRAPLTYHLMLTQGVPPVQVTEHCIRAPPELQPTYTLAILCPTQRALMDPVTFWGLGGGGGDRCMIILRAYVWPGVQKNVVVVELPELSISRPSWNHCIETSSRSLGKSTWHTISLSDDMQKISKAAAAGAAATSEPAKVARVSKKAVNRRRI